MDQKRQGAANQGKESASRGQKLTDRPKPAAPKPQQPASSQPQAKKEEASKGADAGLAPEQSDSEHP